MSSRLLLMGLLLGVSLTGCHTCRKVNYVAGRPRCCDSCGTAPVPMTARMVPVPAAPGAVPAPPPQTVPPPPVAAIDRPLPSPGSPLAPQDPPPAAGDNRAPPPAPLDNGAPPPSSVFPPADRSPPPGERLPPGPAAGEAPAPEKRADVYLGPPSPSRREAYTITPPKEEREPPLANISPKPLPDTRESRDPANAPQPIDLPGFAIARPGVASGLRPFPDGISWLKDQGYTTVLHLRAPGEDNAAARRQFEKKGLTYLSLETSPARLNREVYEQFTRLVTDSKLQPLFVFDKDGSLAGGLWYLHFRVHGNLSIEKARAEAQRLGLRFDDDTEHQAMWLAVQNLQKSLLP